MKRYISEASIVLILALHKMASSIAFFMYAYARSMSPLSKISFANIRKERFSLVPLIASDMADMAKYLIAFLESPLP